jgi:signal transduction histidine kinase
VSLYGTDTVVVLEVSNGGLPIPPHALVTIFDPFSTATRERRAALGLGLGLFIANEIVRAHAGTIQARSTEADGTPVTVQ